MKKCLYILLGLQILSAIAEFFMLLSHSVILAVLLTAVSTLSIVLTLAVINNIDSIEELQYSFNKLCGELKKLKDASQSDEEPQKTVPVADNSEAARGVWECVKCGTVNKQGTTHCINCKAAYSPWTNPTDSPYKKKKLSRWVK